MTGISEAAAGLLRCHRLARIYKNTLAADEAPNQTLTSRCHPAHTGIAVSLTPNASSTTSSSPNEQNMVTCSLCDSGLLALEFDYNLDTPDDDVSHGIPGNVTTRLFHGPCSNCQLPSNDDPNLLLCVFCRHLRLGHLLRPGCSDSAGPILADKIIKFCRFEDIPDRDHCPLCRIIIRSAMPYAYFSQSTPTKAFQGGHVSFTFDEAAIYTRFSYASEAWDSGRLIHHDGKPRTTQPDEPGRPLMKGRDWSATDDTDPLSGTLGGVRHTSQLGGIRRDTNDAPQSVGRRVNWPLAERWLQECLSTHEGCSAPNTGILPPSFRLIDVWKRCLVQAKSCYQYVVLSYVWGNHPDPTKLFATKSTIETLQAYGSLRLSDIPATVEDAMEVCRRLNQDYLWVDRVCIIQDDDDDKKEQIMAMATIYSLASFAIISTDRDSDSGIPGVSRDRSNSQIQVHVSGVNLVNEVANWRTITMGASIWSTRGWTYQEAILARRKIFLTEAQAFFECGHHVLGEDGSNQDAMYSTNKLISQPWVPTIETFYDHVKRYRSRSLTVPSDIYNAIDGVAAALYGSAGPLHYGVPRVDFDRGLLWCMDGIDSGSAGLLTDPGAPSWSWPSWDKPMTLLDSDTANQRNLRYYDTLVAWTTRGNITQASQVESLEIVSGKPISQIQQGEFNCDCPEDPSGRDLDGLLCLATAWSLGCFKRPCPFDESLTVSFTEMMPLLAARWPCHHHYRHDALYDLVNTTDLAAEEFDTSSKLSVMAPGAIAAMVQSAFFGLQGSVEQEPTFGQFCILDEDGEPAGLLVAPNLKAGPGFDLLRDIKDGHKFEFIALSVSGSLQLVQPDGAVQDITEYDFRPSSPTGTDPGEQLAGDENPDSIAGSQDSESGPLERRASEGQGTARMCPVDYTYRDSEGAYLFPIPVINVMLIRREDRFARRVTVGWVYLKSWVKAGPRFGVVCLQ